MQLQVFASSGLRLAYGRFSDTLALAALAGVAQGCGLPNYLSQLLRWYMSYRSSIPSLPIGSSEKLPPLGLHVKQRHKSYDEKILTLKPCGICTMACLWAGISRIAYGAGRSDIHHIYFQFCRNNTVDFIQNAFREILRFEGVF